MFFILIKGECDVIIPEEESKIDKDGKEKIINIERVVS
jgi:hypothetical protein